MCARMNTRMDVERLEGRRLLSASVGAVLLGGELRVTGTEGNDTIVVSLHAGDGTRLDVSLNGATSSFAVSAIRRIRIDGRDGNDSVRIDQSNGNISIPARLSGGEGDDTLVGGSGNDRLDGGDGDDALDGQGGNDQIRGDRGHDQFADDDDAHEDKDRGRDDDTADDRGTGASGGATNSGVVSTTPVVDDHGRRHGGHGADDAVSKTRPDDHGGRAGARPQPGDDRGHGRHGDDPVRH